AFVALAFADPALLDATIPDPLAMNLTTRLP
ncbi:MAG: hypothetical protein RIS44_2109, partial [Pseudomonadota bacterium]